MKGFNVTFLFLTGAGFSRNWGGWLANEAFEYLLACPEVDVYLRKIYYGRAKMMVADLLRVAQRVAGPGQC